ncbi:histidinol-phosphatase [Synoicihabitans lomoniglobus]|uniref:Histidinol-phosphatase n=1 Tax=Synoicihabitans lomoniglobus TaxID=2909285 RepID=A0AAF0CID4_9BACT|nr:histidinol-phosphatase [Opitutaceae bacterium LMO-M01]WED65267.1 histidinol-phosphatase [Opitutaceae bacterium LMO-M01]
MDLSSPREFIPELARASADFIAPFFGNPGTAVEFKSDDSPVTAADRGAEAVMRKMIAHRFPAHGIIGEEHGNDRPDAEWVWVLDPIDGTKSFITGVPLWTTLIGLLHHGEPVLGAIHQPTLGQLVIGDNETTTLNGRPVHTRATTALADATLVTSDHRNLARYQNGTAADQLIDACRLYRTWADGYGYLLLATGFVDICLDPIMNPWDIAALVPVVRGAGGTITDWSGQSPYPAESIAAAATPDLHRQTLAQLNR